MKALAQPAYFRVKVYGMGIALPSGPSQGRSPEEMTRLT